MIQSFIQNLLPIYIVGVIACFLMGVAAQTTVGNYTWDASQKVKTIVCSLIGSWLMFLLFLGTWCYDKYKWHKAMKSPIDLTYYILEQFLENGRIITYMPEYGILPNAYAIFKVKIKDKRSNLEKIFDFGRYKNFLSKYLIANQINLDNSSAPIIDFKNATIRDLK